MEMLRECLDFLFSGMKVERIIVILTHIVKSQMEMKFIMGTKAFQD